MRDMLTDIEAGILLSDSEESKRGQNRSNLPKRFYKEASVVETDGQFAVQLDGRPVRTPGRALLALPTRAAAELVADEFAEQTDVIDPMSMPILRLVNTAIDGVAAEREAVIEDIVRFAGSDMICYRADSPEGLVARQNELWNPVLDWAESTLGTQFTLIEGVMPQPQPALALRAVKQHVDGRSATFPLAALHVMTTLTGSALLALAIEAGDISPEDAWAAAHADEDWQIERWGQDSEAVARRNARRRDFDGAVRLLDAVRT